MPLYPQAAVCLADTFVDMLTVYGCCTTATYSCCASLGDTLADRIQIFFCFELHLNLVTFHAGVCTFQLSAVGWL